MLLHLTAFSNFEWHPRILSESMQRIKPQACWSVTGGVGWSSFSTKPHRILLLWTPLVCHSPSVITFSPAHRDSALNHPLQLQPSAGTSQASAAAAVLQPDQCDLKVLPAVTSSIWPSWNETQITVGCFEVFSRHLNSWCQQVMRCYSIYQSPWTS